MDTNYSGYFDVERLKAIPISIHKLYEELPDEEQRIIVLGLGCSGRNYLERYALSDTSYYEGVITALSICWGNELKIIQKEGIGLYWIDVDEIANYIFEAISEEHMNDFLHRTIIRCLEGERLGEKNLIEKTEGDEAHE